MQIKKSSPGRSCSLKTYVIRCINPVGQADLTDSIVFNSDCSQWTARSQRSTDISSSSSFSMTSKCAVKTWQPKQSSNCVQSWRAVVAVWWDIHSWEVGRPPIPSAPPSPPPRLPISPTYTPSPHPLPQLSPPTLCPSSPLTLNSLCCSVIFIAP